MELVKYMASIRYETFRKRKRNGNECNKGKWSNVLF